MDEKIEISQHDFLESCIDTLIHGGMPVRGNDGVDTVPLDDGYYVQHFHICPDKTTIRFQVGPFKSFNAARTLEQRYRLRFNKHGLTAAESVENYYDQLRVLQK